VLRKKADTIQPGQHEAYLRYMVFSLEGACRSVRRRPAWPPATRQSLPAAHKRPACSERLAGWGAD
jgi:hypothetical protein